MYFSLKFKKKFIVTENNLKPTMMIKINRYFKLR